MKASILLLTALLVSVANPASAQLVTYDFEVDVDTPASVDDGLAAGSFTLSSGTASYAAGSDGRAISGSNWQGAAGDKYWEFSISAGAGLSFDVVSLDFDYRSGATGPSGWGVTINGLAAGAGSLLTDATFHPITVGLAGFSGLTTADIRITGFNGTGATGSWRMDNVVLNGATITQVPEPSTWALLGGGLLVLAHRRWRRR